MKSFKTIKIAIAAGLMLNLAAPMQAKIKESLIYKHPKQAAVFAGLVGCCMGIGRLFNHVNKTKVTERTRIVAEISKLEKEITELTTLKNKLPVSLNTVLSCEEDRQALAKVIAAADQRAEVSQESLDAIDQLIKTKRERQEALRKTVPSISGEGVLRGTCEFLAGVGAIFTAINILNFIGSIF